MRRLAVTEFPLFPAVGVSTLLKRALTLASVIATLVAQPALAQSAIGADASGRFDGSPPLGTSELPDEDPLRIPIGGSIQTPAASIVWPGLGPECAAKPHKDAGRGDRQPRQACAR